MIRRLIAAAAAVAVLAVPGVAHAHTPSVSDSCTGLNVSLQSYTGGATNNRVTVTIDGSPQVFDFAGSFARSFTWPQSADHAWTVVIDANRVTGPATQYDTTFTGARTACQPATTTTTTTNPPVTTTSTASTTTTTTAAPPSSSTSSTTVPPVSTSAPSTSTPSTTPASSSPSSSAPPSPPTTSSVSPTTVGVSPSSTDASTLDPLAPIIPLPVQSDIGTPPTTTIPPAVEPAGTLPQTGSSGELVASGLGLLLLGAGWALIAATRRGANR